MTAPGRRRDVQGLRGVAVVLVVAQHMLGAPSGGFVGVDVFFVISGYVITRSFLSEWRGSGRIDVARFLVARARRLLPSAFVVLAVTSAAALLLFNVPRARSIGLDALSAVMSAANWHFLRAGADYFGSDAPSPLQHFWSLSVEEQFYVVFPMFLICALAIARRARRPSLVVLMTCAAVAVSMVVAGVECALRPAAAYFTTESRAWEFGVGALVALLAPQLASLGTPVRQILGTLGTAGIALSAIGSTGTSFPFPGAMLPVFATAAVLAAGEGRGDAWSSRALSKAPIVLIGDLSYVVYLWHLPVLTFVVALDPRPDDGAVPVLIVLIVTGVAAWMTHRYVEQPMRRAHPTVLRTSRADIRRGFRRAASAGLVTVVIVGCGVQVVGKREGPAGPQLLTSPTLSRDSTPFATPDQLTADVVDGLALRRWPDTDPDIATITATSGEAARLSQCLHDPGTVDERSLRDSLRNCAWGSSDGPVLAVFGDSIALGWTAGAVARYAADGWRVVAVGLQSCAPAAVAVPDRTGRPDFVEDCEDARTTAIAFITGLGTKVVLTSSSVGAFDRQAANDTAGRMTDWRTGLSRTIRTFSDRGATVFVLGAPPEGSDPSVCATRINGPQDCVSRLTPSRKAMESAEVAAVQELRGSARYVQTDHWFCDPIGRCPLIVDDTVVRADRGHITTAFSQRLERVLPVVSPHP